MQFRTYLLTALAKHPNLVRTELLLPNECSENRPPAITQYLKRGKRVRGTIIYFHSEECRSAVSSSTPVDICALAPQDLTWLEDFSFLYLDDPEQSIVGDHPPDPRRFL